MAKRAGDGIIRAIRSAVAAEPTDRELLDRFVEGDEKAFASSCLRLFIWSTPDSSAPSSGLRSVRSKCRRDRKSVV